MRTIAALLRASWFQARSYRLSLVIQIGGLLISVLPLYFITGALESTMAQAIAGESDELFSFVLVGTIALMLVTVSMTSLQGSIAGGISSGYLESLLMTRASLPSILLGMSSYNVLLTLVRALLLIAGGWVIGAAIAWGQLLPALFIIVLLVGAHYGIGLLASALILAFRTAGPLTQVVSTVSTLFGGVYYPITSIPSWLGAIAKFTPLAYGLRPLRQVLLQGDSLSDVAPDLAILVLMGSVILVIGIVSFQTAMRYAKRSGTLGNY